MASTTPDDGWTQAVRQRLGLGRLLPLGGPADGAWLAERAADTVLRLAGKGVEGAALGTLRVGPADPDAVHGSPAVPAPPGSLPPGPLCVRAEFEASPREPIPYTARRLRAALHAAATDRLGLVVAEVDLRVTGLLGDVREHAPDDERDDVPENPRPAGPPGRRDGDSALEGTAAAVAAEVPGVTRLTTVLGARPVHYDSAAPPGPHLRVEVAVAGERRALDVALAVRAAVADAVPGRPSVAVLVTEVAG
ncbi:nucleopolyhedrovirus P10 family protein [Streptomyces sp. NPDC051561]|uniref:nucleopolyhedrovirus P10 family protein n=1 Tax=Streptomyces sp. NPDC051561 TaxID=3365658 RepID=UPI00379D77F0